MWVDSVEACGILSTRLTFMSCSVCLNLFQVKGYVAELNDTNFAALPTRGPCSKYVIPSPEGGEIKGELTLTYEGEPFKVRTSNFIVLRSSSMLGSCF